MKIAEHIERLVNFLKRDEAPLTGDTDGWKHELLDTQEQSSGYGQRISSSVSEEDDDEDSRIEEV